MTTLPSNPPAAAAPKTCGMAIASMVCGIVGFCSLGVTGVAGIVLGVIGVRQIRRSGGALKGRGLAIGGVIVSVVSIVAWVATAIAFGILTYRQYGQYDAERATARGAAARNNLILVTRATQAYASDNDDRSLPPQDWVRALREGRYLSDPLTLLPPESSGEARMFAMNAHVANLSLAAVPQPTETVLFFECAAGTPPGGGEKDLPPAPRYDKGYLVSFCDGHVEQVPPERMSRLIWEPQETKRAP